MELYSFRKTIGENLNLFIRLKGYSKSSFSKRTSISRPTLNQILAAESPNPGLFEEQIEKITGSLGLAKDYFLTPPVITPEKWQTATVQYSDQSLDKERGALVKELLYDLDDLMGIASLYL